MCKIDLPRKNMVIERERAKGRRKRDCWEWARTHTCTLPLERVQGRKKVLFWVEWGEKKTFSCSLGPFPIKKNEVHQQ